MKKNLYMSSAAVMIGALWFNPTALRKAKIVYNFGHSECNSVKVSEHNFMGNSALCSASLLYRGQTLKGKMGRICSHKQILFFQVRTFWKGFGVQRSKKEVTKVVSLFPFKNGRNA